MSKEFCPTCGKPVDLTQGNYHDPSGYYHWSCCPDLGLRKRMTTKDQYIAKIEESETENQN